MPAPRIDLSAKKFAPRLPELYVRLSDKRFGIKLHDRVVPLLSLDEPDQLDAAEKAAAKAAVEGDGLFWDTANNQTACNQTPDRVDRRAGQTPIRNQLDRGTCVCFASLAGVEVFLRAANDGVQDLSEQYANWTYMQAEGRDWCSDGLKTTDSAKYLSQRGICPENLCPYENRATVQTHCNGSPSAVAQQQGRFGIGGYTLIDNLGLNGPSIANTDYLECILSKGYDVVFGTHVAWSEPDPNTLVFDVVLDPYGNPAASAGGHAMLLVGYVRNAPEPYFIFKNSWGPNEGDAGYYYLSYDYVRQYAKYGYVIHDIRNDL